MAEDQRFAAARPDVLSYSTNALEDTLIFMGPVAADIYVSANSSDYDLVIKIIDVYPDTIRTDYPRKPEVEMAGYQQLVRAEIFRAKYRHSYEAPEAILPDKIEKICIPLNDINHAFLPGHRIMVQIQSSWFPLFDRNPQKFMNIYEAEEEDFRKATISIYRSREYPSGIRFGMLP
jgi:putative CocE/NonD family hydrolase